MVLLLVYDVIFYSFERFARVTFKVIPLHPSWPLSQNMTSADYKRTLAFQLTHKFCRRKFCWSIQQDMYMVGHTVYAVYIALQFIQNMEKYTIDITLVLHVDNLTPPFGYKNYMI